MPLIMDDDPTQQPFDDGLDDMTDLFDDAASVMQMPLVSVNPHLPLRVDEIAVIGCRQKLCWASTGAIARISENGQKLHVLFMARRAGQVPFSLSEPATVDLPSRATFQLPIVHASWSPDGHNLAVLDSRGGLVIYQCVVALNRLNPRGLFHYDDDQATGAAVGLEWLKGFRPVMLCSLVERDAQAWRFQATNLKPQGVSHPIPQRQALIMVNRTGAVRFFYAPATDLQWGCATTNVGSCDAVEQLLTHASFCSYKDNIITLATYDVSRTLAIYEITVDWHLPRDAHGQLQPQPGMRLSPTLSTTRIKVIHSFLPFSADNSLAPHQVELVQLQVLPPVRPPLLPQSLPASVMATFSISEVSSHLPSSMRSSSTRLVSVDISDSHDTVHESLSQLASKRRRSAQGMPDQVTAVKQNPPVDVQGTVVSVDANRLDGIVSLIKGDGTVELRDRPSLTPLSPSTDSFKHPLQSGWSFQPVENKVQHALSVNDMMMISRGLGDDLELHCAQMPGLHGSEAENKSISTAALAGAAMAFANGTFQSLNTDDVFEIIRRNVDALGGRGPAIENLFMAVSANPECVNEDAKSQRSHKLMVFPFVQRVLSFQQTLLAIEGKNPIAVKMAKVFMDVKTLCNAVQASLSDAVPQDLANGSNMPGSLLGLAHYFVSMCCYLIDSLLTAQQELKAPLSDLSLADLQSHIDKTRNPTIPIILCSTTRVILCFASRFIRTLTTNNPSWLARGGLQVQLSWQRLTKTIKDSPMQIRRFELLLEEISHHAKEAYESAGMGDAERGPVERRFLISGRVPEALVPVARRLLAASVNKLVEEETSLSPMRLFDMDYSRLGLDGDVPSAVEGAGSKKMVPLDALRKIDLAPGVTRVRRCTRCQSVMEDVAGAKAVPVWLNRFGQNCVCGNRWVFMDL